MEETLREQAPAARGAAGAGARPSPQRFTPLELAAAEQLIHLSESSSSAAFTPRGAASAASASSSSPRSVNAPPPVTCDGADEHVAEDDDDEQEVGGRPRRNKRYLPIAEIYAVTAPIRARGRKDKGAREEEEK